MGDFCYKQRINVSISPDFLYKIDQYFRSYYLNRSEFICLACDFFMRMFSDPAAFARFLKKIKEE